MPVKIKLQVASYKLQVGIRKPLVLAFFILVFQLYLAPCTLCLSYAAPCYGTRMPGKHKFVAGIESSTLFKRYLEDDYGKLRSAQYFLDLSYGVFDWLSIDLKGGAGNVKQRPVDSDELDYPSGFAGGYGFRVRFVDKDKIKAVFGFQHISVHPKKIHIGDVKNQAILDDWQVSLLGSYDISRFTPYAGIKWSRTDYIHWIDTARKRRMSDRTKELGLVLGTDITLAENFWINIEGRLFDEEAASLRLNYAF